MHFAHIELWLWGAGFLGHCILLAVLTIRRRFGRFPIFTALVVYQLLESIVLFLVSRLASEHVYVVTYWTFACADYGFQLGLILELASIVLRPVNRGVPGTLSRFAWWSAAGTIMAAVLSLSISRADVSRLGVWEIRATVFTSLLACGLFLALSASANYLGLRRSGHVFAIGQGFALWTCIALCGNLGRVWFGWKPGVVIPDNIRMAVYIGIVIYWAISLWYPEPVDQVGGFAALRS